MIDYLVAKLIKQLDAAAQLMSANTAEFLRRNEMAFMSTVQQLTIPTETSAIRIRSGEEVRWPLFYPNCYPFRHTSGAVFLPICAS